ncbi:MAG: acyl-CoA reductase [Longimicrobiales bacterium]|nr:acyl-CoA reductase [Longimicrobiales bacterium]
MTAAGGEGTAAEGTVAEGGRRPLDAGALRSAAGRLRAARPALLAVPAARLAELLGGVGERFLDPADPLREEALARVPQEAGISPAMAERVVAGMARDWTRARLAALLAAEFPQPGVLDRFTPAGSGPPRALRALGDALALHVGSGSVPGVCATSLIRSLLVKTPVLVKPGAGDRALTELFLHGLREADADVAAAAAVRYWPGGDPAPLDATLALVERVVAYGSDATMAAIRNRLPVSVPLVAYHHRSSVAVLGPEAVRSPALARTAADLAFAVATFDQRGCVSPHRAWVLGDREEARRLAAATAEALTLEAHAAPPGPRTPDEAARLRQAVSGVEVRRAAGAPVELWGGVPEGWAVILEEPCRLETVGAPRTLVLTWAADPAEVAAALADEGAHLQSAGVAGLGGSAEAAVEMLVRAGVTRVAPLGELPFPPAWWLHDGQGPLRALVRWTAWEA